MEPTPFAIRSFLWGFVMLVCLIVIPALVQDQSLGIRLAAFVVAVGSLLAAGCYWIAQFWSS
jgi:hypothetical protein